jgi:hypothetical protein
MGADWQPISEEDIWHEINAAWSRMDFKQRRVWDAIRILPERWTQQKLLHAHGSWVVAVIGRTLIWYDEVEEGFVVSLWTTYGLIDGDYQSGEQPLEHQMQIISTFFDPSLGDLPVNIMR